MDPKRKNDDPVANAHYLNRLNKIRILDLIRTSESISRAELAKLSGLSAPTVSRIVEDFLEDGLVHEIGEGESQGGRRPTLLKFSERGNYIIGIDLGTTQIHGVLADFEAKILSEVRRPTQVEDGFESVMARTADVIDELRTFPLEGGKRIYGIGLAVAGLINRSRNIVEFSPDFHWQSVDVVEALSHRHPLRIVFDNVTRVMALGEMCFGLGRTYRNLVCINLGYGIGSGIIIDGKPLFGPLGMAGEFGHMTMDRGSRVLCECGNHGCLEALSSGRAIAQAGRNAILAGDRGSMFDIAGGVPEKVSAQTVIEAARQGDQTALEIFDSAMEYLGLGISSLINIFSPEVVVIGGGVAQAGDFLFDKIRSTVKARALAKIASRVIIRPASFGLDTTVLGAVALVLNEVVSLNGHHGKVVR